jgi:hypothetical protein
MDGSLKLSGRFDGVMMDEDNGVCATVFSDLVLLTSIVSFFFEKVSFGVNSRLLLA